MLMFPRPEINKRKRMYSGIPGIVGQYDLKLSKIATARNWKMRGDHEHHPHQVNKA